MRVKEVDRTANVAWSPATQYPIYLAAGTAAQQLDATFSTSSALEIYSLNLAEATLDMPLVSSLPTECRYHKVIWGSHGMEQTQEAAGVMVAGGDNGGVYAYSAEKLIAGSQEALLFNEARHSGPVKALDFNCVQHNLLASGGAQSEIFIWDLTRPDSPMTPGQKSQPPEEVSCISWNRQVQYILASSFATRCVVWDLRKNEPIIKISESMARVKSNMVAWHPEVATQLCLSSEDDHTPVIQLWDLRYATSPVKVLQNHQRGILSIAWCPQDPDLLLSCGKDNRILCWNPNSSQPNGEILCELPTHNHWSFDVQWCPRNPSLISSSSFEGHVTIYSLTGGGHPVQPSNKVAESFNTVEPFSQTPIPQPQEDDKVQPLQKPPKWLRKPVGASFSFGGKLVSFEHCKPQKPGQPVSRAVYISQVVTEHELITRSTQLEQALSSSQLVEFCSMKSTNAADPMQERIWDFLRVNFEKDPRSRYLQLLGYDQNEIAKKVSEHTQAPVSPSRGVDAQELVKKMSMLSAGDSQHLHLAASGQASPSVGSKTPNDSRDELSDGSAAFDEIAYQQKDAGQMTPLTISANNGEDALLTQAILMGNFEAAVQMCLSEDKMAEAIILAIAGGPDLLLRTQKKYFHRNKSPLGRLISSVVSHDWSHIVQTCSLDNWKEALAIILTYAKPDEFATLCDTLAGRLESEGGELSLYAGLCYICSGNVEKFVENWMNNTRNGNAPLILQDLVEKIMILRKAVETSRGYEPEVPGGPLADSLSQYASLLAAQGALTTALHYLGSSQEPGLAILQDRLYQALGPEMAGVAAPPFPFQRMDVVPQGSGYPAASQPAQRGMQAVARGGPQTTVTQSPSYLGTQPSSQYSGVSNGPVSNKPSIYTPAPSTAPGSTSMHAGGLSHKYPSYPNSSDMYGLNTYSPGSQPGFGPQPGFSPAPTQPTFIPPGPQPGPLPGHQPSFNPAVSSAPSQYNPQPNIYNPTSHAGSYAPPTNNSIGGRPPMPSYQETKSETPWNDPPILKERSQPKSFERPTPLTTPLYGQQPGYMDPSQGGMPYAPHLYNPQEHQPAPQIPGTFNQPLQPTAVPEAKPAPAPEPPKPVEKGPVPPEHKVLQDVFGLLVSNCSQVAQHAQIKKKLDDVSHKLEIMYDRLRDASLSENVLLGLHQIVQTIQQYDYNSSLEVYKQMVSHGNFSEISNFMTGIKVLLQVAQQLNVYVQ